MPYYKDADGETKQIDIYEKNTDGANTYSIKGQISCAPFNIPYLSFWNGIMKAGGTACEMAKIRGINALSGKPRDLTKKGDLSAWSPWNAGESNAPQSTGMQFWPVDGSKLGWEQMKDASEYLNRGWTPGEGNVLGVWKSYMSNPLPSWDVSKPPPQSIGQFWDPVRYGALFSRVEETNPILEKNNPAAGMTMGVLPKHAAFSLPGAIIKLVPPRHKELQVSSEGATPVLWSLPKEVDSEYVAGTFKQYTQDLSLRGDVDINGDSFTSVNWHSLWTWHQKVPNEKSNISKIDMPNISYRDAFFTIEKPSLETAYQSSLAEESGLSAPVKIDAHYNFYLLPYEQAISDYHSNKVNIFDGSGFVPIPETMLPNIYALIYDRTSNEPSYRYWDQGSYMPISWWSKDVGSQGVTDDSHFSYLGKRLNFEKMENGAYWHNLEYKKASLTGFDAASDEIEKIIKPLFNPKITISEYLNNFVRATDKIDKAPSTIPNWPDIDKGGVKSPHILSLEKKYHTTGISAYKMKDFILEADKLKKHFPMHVDIEIPASNTGIVGKILYENDLTDIFMQNIMAAMWPRYTARSKVEGTTNTATRFYETLETKPPGAMVDACLIRQDSYFKDNFKNDKVGDISAWEHSLFSETLVKLWLNMFFEYPSPLLDLDAASAGPYTMESGFTYQGMVDEDVVHDYFFKGVPTQYWDWICSEYASSHIKQVGRIRGLPKTIGLTESDEKLRILKPVIFGKEPPQAKNIMSALKWLGAKIKIVDFINERCRSVKEVYDGHEAYSEVLFYEIVKFKASGNGIASPSAVNQTDYDAESEYGLAEKLKWATTKDENNNSDQSKGEGAPALGLGGGPTLPTSKQSFIQNVFIPNIPGMDTLKYIDTQIKFDKGYYYQVYAHTFVVGTQYDCKQGSYMHYHHGYEGEKHNFKYSYKPSVYLMRVPYYNTLATANGATKPAVVNQAATPDNKSGKYDLSKLETTLMWDHPPIFPDAVFLPLYGEKDKVLVNVNFNVGEYDLEPVTIDEQEELFGSPIYKARMNQKKLTGPITYKNEAFCGQIEILRIDKKPTSYRDFSPVSDTLIATAGEGKSNLGFIDDKIIPNKDYYYVVRERDIHGNLSNPSPIYYVRVVAREGEAPYTIFKMFFIDELKKDKPKSLLEFMKYIKIKPALGQRYISEPDIENIESGEIVANNKEMLDSLVGNSDLKQNVFGQKFRFRFTSKKTGRKFDLNLTVKDVKALEVQNAVTSGEPDKYSLGKC